jgi:hypothetical protein
LPDPQYRAVCGVILSIYTSAFSLPKSHKQNFRGRNGIYDPICAVNEEEEEEEEEE